MSAFLCSKLLILNLAARAVSYRDMMEGPESRIAGKILDNFAILWDANTQSLAARYGDTPQIMPAITSMEIESAARDAKMHFTGRQNPNPEEAAQAIADARCFDYQACEFTGYEEHPARRLVMDVVWSYAGVLADRFETVWGR